MGGYGLTTVGAGLMPVLCSLQDWAETWLPEDPAMVERDPDVVLAWLSQTVRGRLPGEPAVLEIWPHGTAGATGWCCRTASRRTDA